MISVIIATHNRADSLCRTLESLGRMIPPDDDWEIVVVDNASSDGTRDTVVKFASSAPTRVHYIVERRPGKSRAVNAGIVEARGDLLVFTDDDVLAEPGWVRALAAAMRTGAIGAGGKIVAEWTAPPPRWLAVDGPDRPMTVVAFDEGDTCGDLSASPFGPNMAFRRDAFERYGLFRTDLGPGPGRYLPGQDTEFGQRLLSAGERLVWVPDAVVRHVHQPRKMTKRYIASWYFAYGRMKIRTETLPENDVRYLGVPRYLVRKFLANVARWGCSLRPSRRFRYRNEAWRAAGAITEAFLGRGRTKAPLLPEIGVLAMVPDEFESPWQTRHQILTRLSSYFHVVWVEPARGWRHNPLERRWGGIHEPLHETTRAFVVYRPEIWLPQLFRPVWLGRLLERVRLKRARQILLRRGCRQIVVSLWRPAFAPSLDVVAHELATYHIDDDYSFSGVEVAPEPSETRLIEAVDLVSVHSRGLMQRKGHLNPRTVFLPNGVDYALYASAAPEPPDLAAIPHQRIGYTGFLKPQLDWALLRELIVSHREWAFVFVGPQHPHVLVRRFVEELAQEPNAHFLGLKGRNELAAYVQHFDVCTMPYRDNDFAKYVYPLKLHEYLASGRPVIGTRIATLEEFSEVVTVASTAAEWSAAIASCLDPSAGSDSRCAARRAVARQHDWAWIAERLAHDIASGLGPEVLEQFEAACAVRPSPVGESTIEGRHA